MVVALMKYYLSLHYWNSASVNSIKKMQLKKFRNIFDYAKEKSFFYREYYGDHGVLGLKIKSLDDIRNGEVILKYGYRSDRGIGVNLVDIEPTDVLISIEDEYNGDTQGI